MLKYVSIFDQIPSVFGKRAIGHESVKFAMLLVVDTEYQGVISGCLGE